MTAFKERAAYLLDFGYSPVPLDVVTGLPRRRRWDELRETPMTEGLIGWYGEHLPDMGLGVAGAYKGFVPIDVDTDDPAIIAAVKSALPAPVVIRRGSKGFVGFWRDPTGTIKGRKFVPPAAKPIVENLSTSVVAIPPTRHRKTGLPYRWSTVRTLFNTHVSELSIITPEHIEALTKALHPWCPPKPVYVPQVDALNVEPVDDKRMLGCARAALERQTSKVASLKSGRTDGLFRSVSAVGKFVHHKCLSRSEITKAFMSARTILSVPHNDPALGRRCERSLGIDDIATSAQASHEQGATDVRVRAG